MQSKQAAHTMPVLKHTPPIIGCGAEKNVAHSIGDTFSFKAKLDGEIIEINEKEKFVKIKYSNNDIATIDLRSRPIKNSLGGFFITTQLELTEKAKKTMKFEKNQILAVDKSFFGENGLGEISYKSGLLVKVALTPLDQTFEDSLIVTQNLIEKTSCEVTMMRALSLNTKTTLEKIVSVGEKVQPSSPLAIFENIGDDSDLANLLDKIGADFEESIAALSKNISTAKYAGEVVEIRTYYNRKEEELSESLVGFINRERNRLEKRKKLAMGTSLDESIKVFMPEYTTRKKVHGEEFDGVLILFFIKTINVAGDGDKYVSQAPLKGIVARVLEKGEEPVAEDGEIIDYILSPLSTISRMTVDVYLQLWTHSILIKTKQNLIEKFKKIKK